LVLLFGAMIMLVFCLSDIGAPQADIGLYGEPIPRSAPLRFPLTALGVLLFAILVAVVQATYTGSTRAAASWARRYAAAPSAWTLSATAIGFATVSNQGRLLALSSAVLALLAFIALCVVVLPERLVALRTRRLVAAAAETRTETLKAENDIRASLLQASSGIVLVAGVVFTFLQLVSAQETTHRQLELTLAGQTADRFTRAVDQLDADKAVDVQLGGIYSLGRIADETPDYHAAISGTLSAYVATRRPLTAEPAGSDRVRVDTLPHLQAALSVLGEQRDFPLAAALPNTDLFGADLRDAVLQDADLSGSSLDDADLEGASIENSSLRGTSFRRTNLSQASMIKVDLRDSDFHDVKAAGMFLTGSNLAGATLSDLRAEDIDVVNVFGDSETEWPKGFDSSRVRSGDCNGSSDRYDPEGPPGC
jgi:hypothetical protein